MSDPVKRSDLPLVCHKQATGRIQPPDLSGKSPGLPLGWSHMKPVSHIPVWGGEA